MAHQAMTREEIFALRETVARIEGKPLHAAREWARKGSFGASEEPFLVKDQPEKATRAREFLSLLEETLAQAGVVIELRNPSLMQAGPASGFAQALALTAPAAAAGGRILQIGDRLSAYEAGLPYAPGLLDFGFRPAQFVYALPRRVEEALWLADTALCSRAFAVVVLEVRGNPRHFGLTESRRLSLKAREHGGILLVLRQGGEEEASSAALRLRLSPAPAAARVLFETTMSGGSIGNSVFHVTVEKSRAPAVFDLLVEWNSHDRRLYPFSPGIAERERRQADSLVEFPAASDRPDRQTALGSVLAFDRAS